MPFSNQMWELVSLELSMYFLTSVDRYLDLSPPCFRCLWQENICFRAAEECFAWRLMLYIVNTINDSYMCRNSVSPLTLMSTNSDLIC